MSSVLLGIVIILVTVGLPIYIAIRAYRFVKKRKFRNSKEAEEASFLHGNFLAKIKSQYTLNRLQFLVCHLLIVLPAIYGAILLRQKEINDYLKQASREPFNPDANYTVYILLIFVLKAMFIDAPRLRDIGWNTKLAAIFCILSVVLPMIVPIAIFFILCFMESKSGLDKDS